MAEKERFGTRLDDAGIAEELHRDGERRDVQNHANRPLRSTIHQKTHEEVRGAAPAARSHAEREDNRGRLLGHDPLCNEGNGETRPISLGAAMWIWSCGSEGTTRNTRILRVLLGFQSEMDWLNVLPRGMWVFMKGRTL